LNPCLRTPPQERKSEIHQRTSHPNISFSSKFTDKKNQLHPEDMNLKR
jgi:hypothetical protein